MINTSEKNKSEYELTDRQYNKLSDLIYKTAGINLGDNKKELVHARLCKVIRKRKISGFSEYISILENDKTEEELTNLLDSIATNVTHFFRENKHFEFLAENIKDRGYNGNLRIWSAGCSSGEEPYSLAITLFEHILNQSSPLPTIVATDISTKILSRAVNGVYPMKSVDTLDKSMLRKYFLKGNKSNQGIVKVKKEVSKIVDFKRLNLMEHFSFNPKFDVIFCRNVMIYFDNQTREKLVKKFYDVLNPGGFLIIGHSESLNGVTHPYNYVKPTIYRK
ncbi:CheR family methyltransferase [Candidatus Latescibacterota bacterium]